MEQFLCTYLSQKYGLKSLVIEQANQVIHAIQTYQNDCIDVQVFGKCLRNQVDEEFRAEQLRLRKAIITHMKQAYKERYTHRSLKEILKCIADLECGKAQVEHWLWNKVINQLFDSTDSFILQDKLRKIHQIRQIETFNSSSQSSAKKFATDFRAEERKRSKEAVSRRISNSSSTNSV